MDHPSTSTSTSSTLSHEKNLWFYNPFDGYAIYSVNEYYNTIYGWNRFKGAKEVRRVSNSTKNMIWFNNSPTKQSVSSIIRMDTYTDTIVLEEWKKEWQRRRRNKEGKTDRQKERTRYLYICMFITFCQLNLPVWSKISGKLCQCDTWRFHGSLHHKKTLLLTHGD